ncbi:protein S100-A7-like 2 [Dromiciops gliroides]|uniref:protein S100-A7-like 2 n=1 Tax=Dromiciops gliroides TaxID=33562 RepID=UPI001CC65763|nr:protein S100-A7-like 2 [Dromiciops gliroides]
MTNTTLEKSVTGVMNVFHKYSTKKEGFDELNLMELTDLIKKEYPTFLSICGKGDPDGFIKSLFDKYKGKDEQVNFNKYTKIIGKITDTYHNLSHGRTTCGTGK